MNAEANIATRLRSLSIDRLEPPPRASLPRGRLRTLGVTLAGMTAALAAAAYFMPAPSANALSEALASGTVSAPAKEASPSSQGKAPTIQEPAKPLSQAIVGSGYVVAGRMITLRPEIGGRVVDLPLDVGDQFVAGQVVARLDATTDEIDLRIASSQAVAATAAARRVEVSLEQARKTLDRTKLLIERGAVATSSLDADSLAVVQLTSDLEVARQTAETARLQVDKQERTLSLHQIIAPFDGVVVSRLAGLGDTVASGTDGGGPRDGIAILLDPTSLTIDADIAQSNAARLQPGQTAVAILDAFPDRPFKMRVRTIVPAASLQKGTVTTRLEFLTPPSRVLPNMAAKVTLDAPDLQANLNK
ncbi:efflux RND transporter periplasmic adaptor subunit (plasmid) [Rhizobium sp. CB3090]|uniref:efflux RND transporter periplasmic adaptor subunit n=1 Tax=Rhizobium sp. CB3090 TaxID=3039156 RepID=UPI0024B25BDC|nr:efflux RND transporter periplasmic adaptor subunit [Rhizobium sp. CB3090]WFU11340.1 efflux RND transporter periplasmic adaptor subunit [Rhizobium sp. CB3090]